MPILAEGVPKKDVVECTLTQIIIKHAKLIDVIGSPQRTDDFFFVPALLEIHECSSRFGFSLDDFVSASNSSAVLSILPEHLRSAWVRARIPRLFGMSPLLCANNWQPLINLPFLAIQFQDSETRLLAYPFVCTEGFDSQDSLQEQPLAGLYFSMKGPVANLKSQIANAFWTLLLKEPNSLESFADYYMNKDGWCAAVGYDREQFFDVPIVDVDACDDDVLFLFRKMRWCFDCDGSGIEDQFPFLDDCGACGGTGLVSW